MRKLKILGLRNQIKKCWEIYCPKCNNLITKISIAVDKECDVCNWKWKGINAAENSDSKIALVLIE